MKESLISSLFRQKYQIFKIFFICVLSMSFAYPIARTIFEIEIRGVRIKKSVDVIIICLIALLIINLFNLLLSKRIGEQVLYSNLMHVIIGICAGLMGFGIFLLLQSWLF